MLSAEGETVKLLHFYPGRLFSSCIHEYFRSLAIRAEANKDLLNGFKTQKTQQKADHKNYHTFIWYICLFLPLKNFFHICYFRHNHKKIITRKSSSYCKKKMNKREFVQNVSLCVNSGNDFLWLCFL